MNRKFCFFAHKPRQTLEKGANIFGWYFLAYLQQIAHRAKFGETGRLFFVSPAFSGIIKHSSMHHEQRNRPTPHNTLPSDLLFSAVKRFCHQPDAQPKAIDESLALAQAALLR